MIPPPRHSPRRGGRDAPHRLRRKRMAPGDGRPQDYLSLAGFQSWAGGGLAHRVRAAPEPLGDGDSVE
jgi:hypothetical protein